MAIRVKFLDEVLGRRMGTEENVYDETLARAWIDAKLAEAVPPQRGAPAHPEQKAPTRPPVHRAVRSAPVTK